MGNEGEEVTDMQEGYSKLIIVNEQIALREEDVRVEFVQASGPGGQNVNKVASAVQLRFDTRTASLPEDVRQRLLRIANKRIGKDGMLLIEAKRYRSQERNREEALERLVILVRRASEPPKIRKKTRASAAEREKRLKAKRRRGEMKKLRGKVEGGE
jgi:ribosome-associated protein